MLNVCKAFPANLDAIMDVLEAAKQIMRRNGNPNQWIGGYPSRDVVLDDIAKGYAFLVYDKALIVGYFAYIPSPEPTYARIYSGNWTDDSKAYHVVHRIGSTPGSHGVFRAIMDWCFTHDSNIRIDTHKDNSIMQHCILSYGFNYCGIIYLASGDQRLAYQLIKA